MPHKLGPVRFGSAFLERMAGHALVGGFFAVRDIRACEKRLDRLLGLRLSWLVSFGRMFRHRDLVSGA